VALGDAHVARGLDAMIHGGDPTPWLSRALGELAQARDAEPNFPWTWNDIGVAHRWLGVRIEQTGGDPTDEYRAALASYRRAVALDPAYVFALSNEADLDTVVADLRARHGEDPSEAVTAAIAAGERCLAVDAKYSIALTNMATAELIMVSYRVERGADPSAELAAVRSFLDRADAAKPGDMTVWLYRAAAATEEARSAPDRRVAAVAAGRRALAEARRLGPCDACLTEEADLDLVEATTPPELGRAVDAARAALRSDPDDQDARLILAEGLLRLGRAAEGLTVVDAALARDPRLQRARSLRAALATAASR
jgi:tetratricopeptide (TPR) repeat protein